MTQKEMSKIEVGQVLRAKVTKGFVRVTGLHRDLEGRVVRVDVVNIDPAYASTAATWRAEAVQKAFLLIDTTTLKGNGYQPMGRNTSR